MNRIYVLLLMAAIVCPGVLSAQDLVKGKLDFLKGVTEMKVVFAYNKLIVGEDGREAAYIKRRKAEKEAKEPGSGAAWEESWLADRKKHYEPNFSEEFTKNAEIKLSEDTASSSKYVMVVNTKFIEVGYNVGVSSHKAGINLEVEIFDQANMKKSVCKIMLNDVRAGKGQFATGPRIGQAYAKAGKQLGKMVGRERG
ncbi:hypothetical protein [Chitinophaga sp. 212800010-3]|jgi:hypothetical protein|uniref:hypothetical protein n=1 Tax=unclassified Chitinophaga TaxID=2619133 RepID=UPI002DF3981F|nr:DUF3313 domain-containing protein [Chitinophaga sp. 212800010-3]